MSQWRRVALQEIPSCKNVIESANDPLVMWIHLWDEFHSAISEHPTQEEKIRQIYGMAHDCFKRSAPEHLCSSAWVFFDYLIGAFIADVPKVRKHLPRLMSAHEFNQRAEAQAHQFTPEKMREAQKAFTASQHKTG